MIGPDETEGENMDKGTPTMEVCICHCIACNFGDHDECFAFPYSGEHRTKVVEAEVKTYLVPKEDGSHV